jgi:hypothetical protein
MSFASPRDGYTSPRGGLPPLPPLPLSLMEECKKAGRLTPRSAAASPRVSPITPRVPPAVPELRVAALLSAAESGALEPQLRTPRTPRPSQRLLSSEGLRSPLPEPARHASSVPLMSSRASSASSSWGNASGKDDPSAAAATADGPAARLWRALMPTNVKRDELRVPTQMFVSVCVAALLFVFSKPHAFLHGKGLWTVITVILVLESTFGATLKKVKLRMVGTLVGGGLGGAIVAAANVINGGWQAKEGELDAVPKSLTVAFSVAACAWFLEFGRLRDPNRECACLALCLPRCCTSADMASPQMRTPWR